MTRINIENPLLSSFNTPFQTPPFHIIKPEHYVPAFRKSIDMLADEIEVIANNTEKPTFENTVVALERSGEALNRVSSVFFNVLGAEATDEMMEISQEVSPLLTESENNIYLNEKLFSRVKSVYDNKNALSLTPEDEMLLDQTFKAFVAQGASLNAKDKEQYRILNTELARLMLTFDQNSLKDKNRFEMIITDENDLIGLPESLREAASDRAKEKNKDGFLFNLSAPSYVPFMRYIENRSLREKMYKAYMSIGAKGDEFDNKKIIKDIVNIRLQISNLLGYKCFADYNLEETMAKSTTSVYKLLNDLLVAYKPYAVQEQNELEKFAIESTNDLIEIMPWDWSFYSEKLKDMRFKINDEMTRPYFELEQVKSGIFNLATQLYGITFKKNTEISVYNPEVETYEVYDENGDFISILYTDFFPRDGKQSGAWMNGIKSQFVDKTGRDSRPQIIIVMNFSRPTDSKPSLLTFDETNTFLHEFGHALHGMLAKGKYASLSGTGVYRDFVELPSQIMENWLTEKEFLDQIATHYETGEKIPAQWIQNLVDASNFNVGYACCRQLSFGFLDMAWHTLLEPFDGDVEKFEKKAWSEAQVLPQIEGALMSTNFSHIFSGGYSAGYYGYKWAEVLDADAFSVFKQNGIFDKQTADSFRRKVLEKGGSENPDKLYKDFRGKEPSIEALLIRNGLRG